MSKSAARASELAAAGDPGAAAAGDLPVPNRARLTGGGAPLALRSSSSNVDSSPSPSMLAIARFAPSDVTDVGGGLTRRNSYASASLTVCKDSAVCASSHDGQRRSGSVGSVDCCANQPGGMAKNFKAENGIVSSISSFLCSSSSSCSTVPKCASSASSTDQSSQVVRSPDGWSQSLLTSHHYPPLQDTPPCPPSPADLRMSNHYGYCKYVGGKRPCRQRSINGYQFCIRHILRDASAPYRSCAYIKVQNGKEGRCSNAILESQKEQYCSTHLIMLGLKEPKKRNKKSAAERFTVPIAEAGVKVPYFPGLDISKGDASIVGFTCRSNGQGQDEAPVELLANDSTVNGGTGGGVTPLVEPSQKVFIKCERTATSQSVLVNSVFAPSTSCAAVNGWTSALADAAAMKPRKVVEQPFVQRGDFPISCHAAGSRPPVPPPALPPIRLTYNGSVDLLRSPHVQGVIPPQRVPDGKTLARCLPVEEVVRPAAATETSMTNRQKRLISLRTKRKSCLSMGLHRHIPTVGRMCHLLEEVNFHQSDLFPLGLEPSDSESDDGDDEEAMADWRGSILSSNFHDLTACSSESLAMVDLKLHVARRMLQLQSKAWQLKATVTSNILCAASAFPDTTAAVLQERWDHCPPNWTTSRPCQHQVGKKEEEPLLTDILQTAERRRVCEAPCLPFSSRCLRHVFEDRGQHLYSPCTEASCVQKGDDASATGFQVGCLSHSKPADEAQAVAVEDGAEASPSTTPKAVTKSAAPAAVNSTELRPTAKEESSHDAQLSFASAVQDLGIEVSEVSEMLSSLPALCSFSGLLESEFGRSDDSVPMARDSLAVDQALPSGGADHNWADVEQFLLSEGYKANFSTLPSPTVTTTSQPQAVDGIWAQCSVSDECLAGGGEEGGGVYADCGPLLYDSSRQCEVYSCNGVQNGYDPFVGCLGAPPTLPDVHPIYTAAAAAGDQYYPSNLMDSGSNRQGFIGPRRFDGQ